MWRGKKKNNGSKQVPPKEGEKLNREKSREVGKILPRGQVRSAKGTNTQRPSE
jgi:hypothetical protein